MSESAALDLQGAIIQKLKNTSALQALVAQRIYDAVPTNRVYPYVSYGGDDSLEDGAEAGEGEWLNIESISIQIDAWSQTVGWPEAKRIAGTIQAALHEVELTLASETAFIEIAWVNTVYLTTDTLTKHAAITFAAQVQRP